MSSKNGGLRAEIDQTINGFAKGTLHPVKTGGTSELTKPTLEFPHDILTKSLDDYIDAHTIQREYLAAALLVAVSTCSSGQLKAQ